MTRIGAGASQRELLAWGRKELTGIEASNPAQDARILLEWALGCDNLWQAPEWVGAHATERFRSGIAQRRARIPLQHIVGRMWFRGLELEARPGVFICRPETEVVAGVAIEEARSLCGLSGGGQEGTTLQQARSALVVDLCTGSGAIAIAVAAEVPSARVVAVELLEAPIDLALANVSALVEGRVDVVRGDATAPEVLAHLDGRVDVVVSNPPYVPRREPVTQDEALTDPETAVYGGGEDGMVFPRGIIHRAWTLLRPGGLLVVEHAESQAEDMRACALGAGYVEVETRQDLAGRDRILVARKS